MIYSDDHGKTWRPGGEVGPGGDESTAVETFDGSLYLNCRNGKEPGHRALRGAGTAAQAGPCPLALVRSQAAVATPCIPRCPTSFRLRQFRYNEPSDASTAVDSSPPGPTSPPTDQVLPWSSL